MAGGKAGRREGRGKRFGEGNRGGRIWNERVWKVGKGRERKRDGIGAGGKDRKEVVIRKS